MKTLSLCLLVACIALVLPAAGVSASSGASCHYVSNGLVGQLTIIGGEGVPFQATDASGAIVGMGVTTSYAYTVPVLGAAPGPLHVRLGDDVLLAGIRDGEWN